MADFVAVIRRAVDGLSDNTPEMRAKVYEKARGAVVRQLESMKPRPPEEMLKRQLDKLESAIIEVESEHALAMPALEALMQEEDEPALAAATEMNAADDGGVPVEEPPSETPVPAEEPEPQPEPYDEPPAPEPEPEPQPEPEPAAAPLGMQPPEPPRNVAYNRGVWHDEDDYVSYTPEPASAPAAFEPPVDPQDRYAAERAAVRAHWTTTPAYEGPAEPYGEVPDEPAEAELPAAEPEHERGDFIPADPFAAEPYRAGDDFSGASDTPFDAPAEDEDKRLDAPAALTPDDGYLDTEADRGYADFGNPTPAVDLSAAPYESARDPWDIPADVAEADLARPPEDPVAPAAVPVAAAAAAVAAPVFTSTSYARPTEPAPPPANTWDDSPFDDVPLPSSPSLAAAPARKADERDLFQQDWGELDSFSEPEAPAAAETPAVSRVETGEIEPEAE